MAQVIAEIEALGVRHVMFIDDNLFGQPRWTRELIAALKPLGVTLTLLAAMSYLFGQGLPALLG